MKKCPYCAEQIQDEAIKCRYCGEMLLQQHVAKKTLSNVCPKCLKEYDNSWKICIDCNTALISQKDVEVNKEGYILNAEKILKDEKPAMITYAGCFLLGILVMLFSFMDFKQMWYLLLIGLGFIFAGIIHRDSIRYTVTNRRIKVKRGILSNKVDEIDIVHIRNVSLRQDFSGTLFNYGNILIGTAGIAGYEIIINGISRPKEIVDIIKKLQDEQRG
jgi:predicted nucleic acid-binding Zn ribbon protein